MAIVRPFKALHYAGLDGEELGRKLLGHPSELGESELREAARLDPHHVLHLYGASDPRATLRQWRAAGVLREEPASFHLLEIRARGATGPSRFLLAAIQPNGVLELEQAASRPPRPPLEPLLTLAEDDHQVLRELLAEAAADRPPELETRTFEQALRLWRLSPSRLTKRLSAHLEEVRLRPIEPLPERAPALAALLPLSDPGLRIRPVHRGLRGVATLHPERFLTVVAGYARVYDLDLPLSSPEGLLAAQERLASLATGTHAVLLVLPSGEGKILRFRQRLELAQIKAAPRNPTLRSLDLALLDSVVLTTVLGIADPEVPGHPNVVAVPSLPELIEKVRRGELQVGFALNPPPLWELRAVIEAEQRLPPATLYVEPAPPAGLLFLSPD